MARRARTTAGAGASLAAIVLVLGGSAASAAVADSARSERVRATGVRPAPLRVVQDPIPYGRRRRADMTAYARRHYGIGSAVLRPRRIVLHYTVLSTYAATRRAFVANRPSRGERPGVCAHFVVAKRGTVYQLVPTNRMCRHTVGLNHVALGIEIVQEGGAGPSWAVRQILRRRAQVGATVALVRRLQARFGIPTSSVIGHAMANDDPLFRDRLGWRNDHHDWGERDVVRFRALLRR